MEIISLKQIKNNEEIIGILRKEFDLYIDSLLLESEYNKNYFSAFEDFSFCCFSKDFSSLIIILMYKINDEITLDEAGARVFIRKDTQKDCINLTLKYIENVFVSNDIKSIYISEHTNNSSLSIFSSALLNLGYASNVIFDMQVPFIGKERQQYHCTLRKSYKSLINWGKRNIKLCYVNKADPNRALFDSFRFFHYKIANKITRNLSSWDTQYEMILCGHAELSLGYMDGKLVTGIFTQRHLNGYTYAVGVHERELFKYGVSHHILYDAVCRNMEKKTSSCFSLGYYKTGDQGEKIKNINFFKKGFCTNLKPVIVWNKKLN